MKTLQYFPLGALLLTPALSAQPSSNALAQKEMATQERDSQVEASQRLCKLTELNGLSINNRVIEDGESKLNKVADFADLIFDVQSMEPQYALFSRGGLGSIGDTLIAVPIGQLTTDWKLAEDADELPTLQLLTDLTDERLEKAPEFSEDAWKKNDFTWVSETAGYFNDSMAGKEKEAVKATEASSTMPSMIRLSEIMGNDLNTLAGDKLADVHNLIINPQTMKVSFVVVGSGGVLGIGEEMRAIPFRAIQHHRNEDGEIKCTTTLTQAQLEAAPEADPDLWETQGTMKFAERVKNSVRVSEGRRKKAEETK